MYSRPVASTLLARLSERPQRIQILAGPRQVGKTTLVRQLMSKRHATSFAYFDADHPAAPANVGAAAPPFAGTGRSAASKADAAWLVEKWQQAAMSARAAATLPQESEDSRIKPVPHFVLVIDEIQKVPRWSETIKGLWDANAATDAPLHLVLLGSSPLLMQRGLTETLAGRFEVIPTRHWSFAEMNEAFAFTLDQYVYFGGYPGAAERIYDEERWRRYVIDSLIQPNIERDILEMTRVDKPALLKQLFEIGCAYSGQIVALDKVLGTLREAGNTVTLTRYLDLLERAGLLAGLNKYSDHEVRRRRSPPKFQVLNTALMSAGGTYTFDEARADRSHWGRLVESAVGAHLCNTTDANTRIHYWRESSLEVDFVIEHRKRLAAIEVKSGKASPMTPGLEEFARRHRGCRCWTVGSRDLPLGEFLRYPAAHWVD